MKKLLLFLVVTFLTSCILVDDLGGYWDKGVIDPALVGTWKQVYPAKKSPENGDKVTLMGDALQVDSLNKEELEKKDYKPVQFKTLMVPPYTFFMVHEGATGNKGALVRYKLTGKSLEVYVAHSKETNEYLRTAYPDDMKGLSLPIVVHTLDKNVLKLLSLIPDEPTYWQSSGKWEKQTSPDTNK